MKLWIHENGLFLSINSYGTIVTYTSGMSAMMAAIIPIGTFKDSLENGYNNFRCKVYDHHYLEPIILKEMPIDKFITSNGDNLAVIPRFFVPRFEMMKFDTNFNIEDIQILLIQEFFVAGLEPFFVLTEVFHKPSDK